MQNLSPRLKIALAAAAIILVAAIAFIVVRPGSAKPSATGTPAPGSSPSASGNPAAATTPQPVAQATVQPVSHAIVFVGVGDLLTHGVSARQLENLQYAFNTYSASKNLSLQQVRVDGNSIHKIANPNFNQDGLSFEGFSGQFDQKTAYDAKLTLDGLTTIRLLIYNPGTTTLLYDSGNIDTLPDQD